MATKTKYDPAFCDRVIELGKTGASKAELANEFGVDRSTLDAWVSRHEDFADAMKLAYQASLIHWEGELAKNLGNKSYQTHLATRLMSARFPAEWRESSKVQLEAVVAHVNDQDLPAVVREKIAKLAPLLGVVVPEQLALPPNSEEEIGGLS